MALSQKRKSVLTCSNLTFFLSGIEIRTCASEVGAERALEGTRNHNLAMLHFNKELGAEEFPSHCSD